MGLAGTNLPSDSVSLHQYQPASQELHFPETGLSFQELEKIGPDILLRSSRWREIMTSGLEGGWSSWGPTNTNSMNVDVEAWLKRPNIMVHQ